MIKDVHKALYQLFSEVGVDVYLSGHVPDDARFPYLTFNVASEDAFNSTFLTVMDWHRASNDGQNVNNERAEMMEQIAELIPYFGLILPLDSGGMLALHRNDSSFQMYYDDPEDPSIIGGRTSYIARFYTV